MKIYALSSRRRRRSVGVVAASLALAAGAAIVAATAANAAGPVDCQAGDPAYVSLFSGNPDPANQATDTLWSSANQSLYDYGHAVAPGTHPSVAALPCGMSGLWQMAWQGTDGYLYVSSATGPVNLGVQVAAGTSPSLTELTGGGYEIAYHAPGGTLGWAGTAVTVVTGGSTAMAPGTDPSIAPLPDGNFRAVWQGANTDLFTTGPNGPIDLGVAMQTGTSPSLTKLDNGDSAVAVQSANGHLWTAEVQSSGALIYVRDVISSVARPMDFATSPSITEAPNNSFYAAYVTQDGDVVVYPFGGIPVDLSQVTGVQALGTTGPAIAYDNSGIGGYVVGFEDCSDAYREVTGSFPATYFPPSPPGPTNITAPAQGIVSAPVMAALPIDPSVG